MMASVTAASTRSVSTSDSAEWPTPSGAFSRRRSGTPSRSATSRQGGAGAGGGPGLVEPARAETLGLQARIEPRGDGEAEHAVAQEGQPRVVVRAALGPGRVREDLA